MLLRSGDITSKDHRVDPGRDQSTEYGAWRVELVSIEKTTWREKAKRITSKDHRVDLGLDQSRAWSTALVVL